MSVAAAAGIGFGAEDALALVVKGVVQAGEHADGVAKGRVRGYVLNSFAINPNFAAIAEALKVFLRR